MSQDQNTDIEKKIEETEQEEKEEFDEFEDFQDFQDNEEIQENTHPQPQQNEKEEPELICVFSFIIKPLDSFVNEEQEHLYNLFGIKKQKDWRPRKVSSFMKKDDLLE